MDKIAAGRWVDALTSGEYVQTKNQLGTYGVAGGPDAFCCLGVLCDIMLDDDAAPITLDLRGDQYDDIVSFSGGESGVVPGLLQKYLNMHDGRGDYSFWMDQTLFETSDKYYNRDTGDYVWPAPYDERGPHVAMTLTSLNDRGFTFSQIADIIRWVEGV